MFKGLLFATFAAQEYGLAVDGDLDRRSHGTEAVALMNRAGSLGLREAPFLRPELGQRSLDLVFLIARHRRSRRAPRTAVASLGSGTGAEIRGSCTRVQPGLGVDQEGPCR